MMHIVSMKKNSSRKDDPVAMLEVVVGVGVVVVDASCVEVEVEVVEVSVVLVDLVGVCGGNFGGEVVEESGGVSVVE